MTDTLKELSDKELSLGNTGVFSYVQASPAPRLDNTDFPFADVHNAYLEIHNSSDDEATKTECIKRMVFLNWYYMVEPGMLTGITHLDEQTINASFSLLNEVLKAGKLDEEFTWMLTFYSTWDYVFLNHQELNLPELTDFVIRHRETTRQKPPKRQLDALMDNRGQMGRYWQSHNESR